MFDIIIYGTVQDIVYANTTILYVKVTSVSSDGKIKRLKRTSVIQLTNFEQKLFDEQNHVIASCEVIRDDAVSITLKRTIIGKPILDKIVRHTQHKSCEEFLNEFTPICI